MSNRHPRYLTTQEVQRLEANKPTILTGADKIQTRRWAHQRSSHNSRVDDLLSYTFMGKQTGVYGLPEFLYKRPDGSMMKTSRPIEPMHGQL